MQKLQLKAIELAAGEVLTRSQLKNILGGSDNSCYTKPLDQQCANGHVGCCPAGVCVYGGVGGYYCAA